MKPTIKHFIALGIMLASANVTAETVYIGASTAYLSGDAQRPYPGYGGTVPDMTGLSASIYLGGREDRFFIGSIHPSLEMGVQIGYTYESVDNDTEQNTVSIESHLLDLEVGPTITATHGALEVVYETGVVAHSESISLNNGDSSREGNIGLYAKAIASGDTTGGYWEAGPEFTMRESNFGRSPYLVNVGYYFGNRAEQSYGVVGRIGVDRIEVGIRSDMR